VPRAASWVLVVRGNLGIKPGFTSSTGRRSGSFSYVFERAVGPIAD
jgi:hypothetical protein